MINSNHLKLLAIGALATAMAVGLTQPAHATLTSLTVTLSDPVNFPDLELPSILSDTVAVITTGKEIVEGNGTNIGNAKTHHGSDALLLANEYVDARPTADTAADNRIVLGLEAGADPMTGYSSEAYYSFSNFGFSTPSIVTGVNVSSSTNIDLDNPSGQVSFAHGVITVLIGNLSINGPLPQCTQGVSCGTITLDLTVQAVPEPGTFALIGAGLLVVAVVGRPRRRG
jgi:hypothetical protein